jgi:gluconate 2-dehydrogenase alpha chain
MRIEKKKDVVIVGLGWTGSILGMELAQDGLEILALERGPDRSTVPDFQYPQATDELRYGVRYGLMQQTADMTCTIRHRADQTALPYRQLGSFLPGTGVGGAGSHWAGQTWRPQAFDLRMRSATIEKFGGGIIPDDMFIQDYGVDYDELEPFLERFERVAGVAGQAGNLRGEIQTGGNPFESPRANPYPMPPLPRTVNSDIFAEASRKLGYHPFPRPVANASQAYVNPYGMQMGPCNLCGFCSKYGCINYSKGSPQTCILDALKRKPNFEYRVHSTVLRIEKSKDGKTATGVTYFDGAANEEVFQPADLVIVAAFVTNNAHLMLVSGIGAPYDPATGEGVIGRSYTYQLVGQVNLFFRKVPMLNFIGAGGNGTVLDDFSTSRNDFRKLGFIGGAYLDSTQYGGAPLTAMSLPAGTPAWGAGWKQAISEYYGHSMYVGMNTTMMPRRGIHLDLDPTYRDRFGRPLMRMTFDWPDNELRASAFYGARLEEIAKAAEPDIWSPAYLKPGDHWDTRHYQNTHNAGGVIMGEDRRTSALNRYMQSWDAHNVFVLGASALPQNFQYNPTGLVGGLAYWAAHAIRTDYLPNPRPLV